MAVRVPINGETLRWARLLAHVDVGALARAVGVKPDRIREFEADESDPTYRQASLIAQKLDRTLSFLLIPPPDEPDIPETVDFRGRGEDETPELLAREMKRAEEHRDALLGLEEEPGRVIVGRIARHNVQERATELRERLGLNGSFVPPESQPSQAFNFWRGLLEASGYLVFQTTRIDLKVFKGLSIEHETLPIIIVNGGDANNGKIFTLFHEFAHLANRTSGLCILNDDVREEAVANAFAANFLMPEAAVRSLLATTEDAVEGVERIAARFKVSTLAAAIRLHTLQLLDTEELDDIWKRSDEQWEQERKRQKEGTGFVPQWRLKYRDLGPRYVGSIARAIEDERVDWVDATYLLEARLPMVEQMLAEYYRTGGGQG